MSDPWAAATEPADGDGDGDGEDVTHVIDEATDHDETATADAATTHHHGAAEAADAADADRESDEAIDALDDGSGLTGGVPVQDDVPGSDVLFVLAPREHFAALDDPGATGDARVDAATSRLVELPDLPTSEHVEVYDDVHRRLTDALADAEVN